MGDRAILGSMGSGFGSVSSVERLDANSVATPTYSEARTIGSKTAFLTPADAEAFDRWDKPNVSVATNGSTFERLKAAVNELLEGL